MEIKNKKIGVLAGGPSSERDISLKSGEAVYEALKSDGCNVVFIDVDKGLDGLASKLQKERIDVAFIALHGRFGEDGTVQKFLEGQGISYTGSGPEASQLALDKLTSKKIFTEYKIKIPPYRTFTKGQRIQIDEFGLPYVVKPRYEGSSIGLSIVREEKKLKNAVDKAYIHDNIIIIEKYVKGDEITVGILDDEPLCVIQIVPASEFYDYEAKYTRPDTKYLVPAPIEKGVYEKSRKLAKTAYTALRCRGFSRVDMILDDSNEIYVLEVNTIPGLTSRSLLPKAAEHAGIGFNELCRKIIELALKQ